MISWSAAILAGATILATVVCLHASLIPALIAFSFLILFLALSRFRMAGLVVFYIVAEHFCQFMKRVIFLLGDQPQSSYYALQLLPTMVLLVTFLSAVWLLRKVKFSPAAYALLGYVAISVVTTMASPAGANMNARFGGLNQSVLPVTGYFIAMTITLSAWSRVAKVLLVLLMISVPYGLYQLIFGPTPADIAWAMATHSYSVAAWKVWMHLRGLWPEYRAYAYYMDHLTWGTFLMNATLFILACVSLKVVPRYYRILALGLGMAGLVACETRGIWLSFIGSLILYRSLSLRAFRRPMLMMSFIAASFVTVVVLGSYLRQHVNFALTSSSLLNRYLTIGTISARTSAPQLFLEELPSHALYGGGFGTSYLSSGMDSNLKYTPAQYSHNILVDLLLSVGLPGLLTVSLFFYLWVKEAFWVIRMSDLREARAIRWLVALFVGGLLSSGINSLSTFNFYFFFLLGLVTAEWSRKKIAFEPAPQVIPSASSYPALEEVAPYR